jgi:hypothetical protein
MIIPAQLYINSGALGVIEAHLETCEPATTLTSSERHWDNGVPWDGSDKPKMFA